MLLSSWHIAALCFRLLFAAIKTVAEDGSVDQPSGRCEFSLQKVPGLSPLVKTDRNGRSCRGEVLLPFCRGVCPSRESGTHTFPYREKEAYFCGLAAEDAPTRNVTLEECDEGVEEGTQHVQISTATECKCIKMP